MPLIVQKYGGTSLNTFQKREKALSNIIAAKDKGYEVVVVVSAMGRKGEPYATDTLIDYLKEITPNPDPSKKDLIMSCGEIISATVMAQSLEEKGYKAVAMTGFQGGIQTDNNFNNAQILNINPELIKYNLAKGNIIVIAGFQGITEKKEITTLGRGGSDTTAIALAGVLDAEIVEIYTDVPGIAITDPRLLPEAPFLEAIDFKSMYLLASAGAQVIHPRAVKTAMKYKMPIKVLATSNNKQGTLIGNTGKDYNGLYGIAITENITIFKTKYEGLANSMKNNIISEIFFTKNVDGYSLALQEKFNLPNLRDSVSYVSDICKILTIIWKANAGINASVINNLFQKNNIYPQGFFPLENGGAWAVPTDHAKIALNRIFDNFFNQKALKAN